jgi:hypothetical protein
MFPKSMITIPELIPSSSFSDVSLRTCIEALCPFEMPGSLKLTTQRYHPRKHELWKFRITPQLLGLEETALIHVRQKARRPQKHLEGRANRTIIAPVGYRTSDAKLGSFRNVYKSVTLYVYNMPSKSKYTHLLLGHTRVVEILIFCSIR